MYYEIPLYWHRDKFTVPASMDDLGEGWASEIDLVQEAANGYPVERILADALPVPLENPTFAWLQLYRIDGQNGPSYFGVYEKL